MTSRLRQQLCSHGRGRWVVWNVCMYCYKKLGETPDDRWKAERRGEKPTMKKGV